MLCNLLVDLVLYCLFFTFELQCKLYCSVKFKFDMKFIKNCEFVSLT